LQDGSFLTDTHAPEQTVVRTVSLSTASTHAPTTPVQKKNKHSILWAVVILAAAASLVIVGMSIARSIYDQNTTTASSTPTMSYSTPPVDAPAPKRTRSPRSIPTPETTPYPANAAPRTTIPLTPEFIQLGSNRHQPFAFSTGSGGRVTGQFSAQGGIGNDVRVILFVEGEYTAFKNGYPSQGIFDRKVSGSDIGNIDVSVQPGNYVLVIMNPSEWTARRIRAPIFLIH
jgi:hypothetical protein